jgi:hypothetical protein
MNFVETVAPISIENLKKYFTDKTTFFVIGYKDSTLKGIKLLTYLSNLDIPCDIDVTGCEAEEVYALIADYLHASVIVTIPSLEKATTHILLQTKGIIDLQDSEFIDANKEIIQKWISKLESLSLYNMYVISSDSFKEFVNSYEVDETNETVGVNFVSLLKNEDFFMFYGKITPSNLKYYKHYFNDYMFKGKNMYSYWANENNPMFLLTYGIAEGIVTSDEYISATKKTIEELANATPV